MSINQQVEAIAVPETASKRKPWTKKKLVTKKISKKPVSKVSDTAKASKKPKKPKLVRDSFTIPADEYQILTTVKKQLIAEGFEVKKTEVLRIALALLSKTKDSTVKRHLNSLQKLKVGRPKG